MYLKLKKDELTLFYNSKENNGKMTLAYSTTLKTKVNRQDISSGELSSTVIKNLINSLGIKPKHLLNKAHPYYQENLAGKDFDDWGWLNIIQKNPFLIKAPIAYYNDQAVLCETPTDIFKLKTSRSRFSQAVQA